MKKFARITALFLAALMLVCGLAIATTAAESDYSEAAKNIYVLGIKLPETSNTNLNRNLTKSEATLLLAQASTGKTDLSVWNTPSDSSIYTDVYSYGAVIDYMSRSGIVMGNSNDVFGFDDTVEYQEALAYAVRVLGYETEDMIYPFDHIFAAEKLGLADNIANTDYYKAITYGEFSQLLWDMLNTQVAAFDSLSGKLLYPGEEDSMGVTTGIQVNRFTLLADKGFCAGMVEAVVSEFIAADEEDAASVDTVVIISYMGDIQIRAEDVGITADTPKVSYLGLPVSLYINCDIDDFTQDAYDNGEVSVIMYDYADYTVVTNVGKETNIQFVVDEDDFDKQYLYLGGEKFAAGEYDFVTYVFDDGWKVGQYDVCSAFEYKFGYVNESNTYGQVAYRVIESYDDYYKDTVELLYTPYEFGQYNVRTFKDGANGGELSDYVTIGTYRPTAYENPDEEMTYFVERLVGANVTVSANTLQIPAMKGAAAKTVSVEGVDINPGEFMFYNYNATDNILTVAQNCGGFETGRLTGTSAAKETVIIDNAVYELGFDGVYACDFEAVYDAEFIKDLIENFEAGEDNVKYISVDGRVVYFEAYATATAAPQFDFAIVSLDADIMAYLLGMSEVEYAEAVGGVTGLYAEDGAVKVAMLNLAAGKWELVTVASIATEWNAYDNQFDKESDLAKAFEYSELLGESAPAKYTDIVNSFKSIVSQNLVVVVSEENGVYTLADETYSMDGVVCSLLVSGDAPDGLSFNATGRTNMITADNEVEPARVSTGENTVIVAIGADGVGVRIGVQTTDNSLPFDGRFYSANENLIVFWTHENVVDWGDEASATAEETYYVVLSESMMEVELTDDELYAVTFTDLFDLKNNTKTDITILVEDAYYINEFADSFCTGAILFQTAYGEVMYTVDALQDILLNLHPDCAVAEITEFIDAETIGGTIGEEYLSTAMAVDSNVNVVTLDFTDVDFEDYDLDSMFVDLAYDEAFGYDVDTVKVGDAEYYAYSLENIESIDIEEPTEGIYDQFIIDTAGHSVFACNAAGEYEELFTVELVTVGMYDNNNGTVSLYVFKLLCGEGADREPVVVPETPTEVTNYDVAVVTLDKTVMAYLLGMSEAEYENSLTSGLYVKDNLVAIAVMNTATGRWELGYVDSVAFEYSAEDDAFTTSLNMAEAAAYYDTIGENYKNSARFLEASVILNGGLLTVVSEENGVYVLAALNNELVECASNYNGLLFDADGTTNAITVSADVAAQSYTTHEGSVIIAVDANGNVGVRYGVQNADASIVGNVTYYAVGNDTIVLSVSDFDVVGWSMFEIEELPDEDAPSEPIEYTYAIVSLNADIIADLLDMSYTKYADSLTSGFYIKDDLAAVAVLNTETGRWEIGYIDTVAYNYDAEKAAFTSFINVAEAAVYNDLLLNSKYADQVARTINLINQQLVVVVSEKNGVYTIAANEASLLTCCENTDGLIFSSVGRTNKITADPQVEAARVSINDNTVIVAVGNDTAGARVGMQTPEFSITAPVVFYSANENLIVFTVDAEMTDWIDARAVEDEKYYITTGGVNVEVSANDDESYTAVIDGVFDLKNSEMSAPLVVVTEALDGFLDIVEGMILWVSGGEVAICDTYIDEVMVACLNDNEECREWEVVKVDSFVDSETIALSDANGDVIVDSREALAEINVQVVTLDYTGRNWAHFDTDSMFVQTGTEDASMAIEVYGEYLYGELLNLDTSEENTIIYAPVAGIYNDFIKNMAGKLVFIKSADGNYDDAEPFTYTLNTYASYDASEGTLQLYVLRKLCNTDGEGLPIMYGHMCGFSDFGQYSATQHARICSCGFVEYQQHTFGEWVEITAATADSKGVKVRTCSECLYKEKADIPTLDVALISVESVIGRAGHTVDVDVLLRNSVGIGGIEFAVEFDNELLTLEAVTMADGFSAFTTTPAEIANQSGSIEFCFADTKNLTSSGTVATLSFALKEGVNDRSAMISVDCSDSVAFYYDGTKEVDLALDRVDGKVTIFDYIPGDIYEDDKINVRDAALLLQSIARWDVSIKAVAADVNCDGNVNIRDAAMILQYIAGWDVTLGVAAAESISLFSLRESASATVMVTDGTCKPGESVTVDVMVIDCAGFGGMEFSVDFDNSMLVLDSIDTTNAIADFTITPVEKANANGRITFGYVGLGNVTNNGTVATLTFTVAQGATGGVSTVEVVDRASSFYYEAQAMMDLTLVTINGSITVDVLVGDIDGNNEIDMLDCMTVLKSVMDDADIENADMNGDGAVTLIDVIRMLKAMVA